MNRILVAVAVAAAVGCGTVPADTVEVTATPPSGNVAYQLLGRIPVAAQDTATPYDPSRWLWGDTDTNGCQDNHDVLRGQALRVDTWRDRCRPDTGLWRSWYEGREWPTVRDVEVDHVVARWDAHVSGGAAWDDVTRDRFVGDPDNLVVATEAVNASKSNRGPDAWPWPGGKVTKTGPTIDPYSWCLYAQRYTVVKARYGLTVTASATAELRRVFEEVCP